jgi:hypothetical protein
MKKSRKKIDPCPFCGCGPSKDPLEFGPVLCCEKDEQGVTVYWVYCEFCHAQSGKHWKKGFVIASWNIRDTEKPLAIAVNPVTNKIYVVKNRKIKK